jgi:CRISPR-associated protein Cas5t
MHEKDCINLLISVPVCSFRKGFAREYLETERVPPPSTVYGFLLSLIGEEDRFRYIGTRIAYALLSRPELSVVLRTIWRIKDKKVPIGTGANKRPDYQEILTDIKLAIWACDGELSQKIRSLETYPEGIKRYGGLSLGESRDLINDISWFPEWKQEKGKWLMYDRKGDLPLPIWVDHVGSKETVWRQFRLQDGMLETPSENDNRWITIQNT